MAGSDTKITWLKEDLSFDHVINYKTCKDFKKELGELAPDGIDVFYDNVSCFVLVIKFYRSW